MLPAGQYAQPNIRPPLFLLGVLLPTHFFSLVYKETTGHGSAPSAHRLTVYIVALAIGYHAHRKPCTCTVDKRLIGFFLPT